MFSVDLSISQEEQCSTISKSLNWRCDVRQFPQITNMTLWIRTVSHTIGTWIPPVFFQTTAPSSCLPLLSSKRIACLIHHKNLSMIVNRKQQKIPPVHILHESLGSVPPHTYCSLIFSIHSIYERLKP